MDNQEFLGYLLNKKQKVLSILGPSGVGKSFSSDFLSRYFAYKVARQITTRDPRADDVHYNYMTRQEFIKLLDDGKMIGFFSGDKETLQGNGYGYRIDYLLEELDKYSKLILFPSAYELKEPDFLLNYGTTQKIGIGYKDINNVLERAKMSPEKNFTIQELKSRCEVAKTLTDILEFYKALDVDKNYYLLYTDSYGKDNKESKKGQLKDIAKIVGCKEYEAESLIEDYIEK